MSFTDDGKSLLYEAPAGLGIYDRESGKEAIVATKALSGLGLSASSRGILMAIEGSGSAKSLLCAAPDGNRLFSLPFSGESSFASISGDAVFLGIASSDGTSRLVRMDFKEE